MADATEAKYYHNTNFHGSEPHIMAAIELALKTQKIVWTGTKKND